MRSGGSTGEHGHARHSVRTGVGIGGVMRPLVLEHALGNSLGGLLPPYAYSCDGGASVEGRRTGLRPIIPLKSLRP